MAKRIKLLSIGNYVVTCDFVDLVAIPIVAALGLGIAQLVLWWQ